MIGFTAAVCAGAAVLGAGTADVLGEVLAAGVLATGVLGAEVLAAGVLAAGVLGAEVVGAGGLVVAGVLVSVLVSVPATSDCDPAGRCACADPPESRHGWMVNKATTAAAASSPTSTASRVSTPCQW
ncbi:MAG: hypothetical protein ACR2LF_11585 [Jatrophihabitantaceae bacterium]